MVSISRAPADSENEIAAQDSEGLARTVLGESSVWGLLGHRRKGKTTYAGRLCWQAWLKGVRVLHLGNLTFGEQVDPVELANQDPADLGNCLLFVDEAGQILPSTRTSTAFQLLVNSNLVQSGHQGLSVIWTTQFEVGLSRRLTEQTDWVYYVQGASRYWTTDRQIDTGRVLAENDNRCEAWNPESDFHTQHTGFSLNGHRVLNDCRDTERQHTIIAECVSQWGNPLGPGKRTKYTLHCAQRFFPLIKTSHKVDAMAAMMVTTDQLRDQEQLNLVESVSSVLLEAGAQGFDEAAPANINAVISASLSGVELTPNNLGRILNYLGVPKKRTSKGPRYNLKAWYDEKVGL